MEPDQFSLFPRRPDAPDPGVVEVVGARGLRAVSLTRGLAATLSGALGSLFTPGAAAREVARAITFRQIFFTGFEALPLVSVIAALVGATIVLQVQIMAQAMPDEMVGMILVAVILREMAPLTTATIVAGRSGTAIATELGNMKVNAEVLGLASMGIDPPRFIVFPRLVGCVVSIFVLTIYFGAVAIFSGYAVGMLTASSSFGALQSGFSAALRPEDLALYLVKCTGLGVIVGWLSCHFGLEVQGSPTEVPAKASQAVVMSLVVCVGFNALVTAGFYAWVGPPIR